jgi:hypothetical protein
MEYQPVRVVTEGTLLYRGGRLHLDGWAFDLGGRADRPDWDTAYADELMRAALDHLQWKLECTIAGETNRMEAARALAVATAVVNRIKRQAAPRRPWWRRLMGAC